MIRVAFILILLFSTPAWSGFEESDASYYGRHKKSCIHPAPRENIWDLFKAFRERVVDECCMASVEAMQTDGARRIDPEDPCPEGTQHKALDCPTSKHWCAQ